MKYIILQGDGMADYPIESLGGKTPLGTLETGSHVAQADAPPAWQPR